MQLFNFVLLVFITSYSLNAANIESKVLKLGKRKNLFAISNPLKDPLKIQDERCLFHPYNTVICGKIIRVEEKFAILEVPQPTGKIVVGDVVTSRSRAFDYVRGRVRSPASIDRGTIKIGFHFLQEISQEVNLKD